MPGTIELLFLASLLEDSKKGALKCTIFCVKKLQKEKIRIIQKYFFYENFVQRESEKVALMLSVIKMYNNNSFPIIY